MYGKNGGHVEKTAAILDYQVVNQADLTSNPQKTSVPNVVLVSQFARLVPLSAPLTAKAVCVCVRVCARDHVCACVRA